MRPIACFVILLAGCREAVSPTVPYDLDIPLLSRSACFENPSGEAGAGGRAASHLGVGRKGSPLRRLGPGEEVTLCDLEGPGVIRHVWMTTRTVPEVLRSLVIRAFWDGQAHPSIECPVGDFFGFAHGEVRTYASAAHNVSEKGGMNLWLPMPFPRRARVTLANEGKDLAVVYYQVDYTLGDALGEGTGRLHACFRRENPTSKGRDFEILPKRTGRGRFLGCVLGVRPLESEWWGEGEFKAYLDGDEAFPTICGTGSEDYVGLAWGLQATPFPYHGCSLKEEGQVSMYRWHLPDPIYWKRDCRISIQQIGLGRDGPKGPLGLRERSDDWSAAAFWYEPVPSAPLPIMPGVQARTADLGPAEPEKP